MYNYFSIPYFFGGSIDNKAEHNPKNCEELPLWEDETQNNNSSFTVERTYNYPSFTDEELKTEQWKQIKGFEKYYVSNLGRIYSTKTNKILKPSCSINVKNKTKRGRTDAIIGLYDYTSINPKTDRYKCFFRYVSNLVAEYFIKTNTNKNQCLIHLNGNKFDNRTTNLKYVSFTFKNNLYITKSQQTLCLTIQNKSIK